MSDEIRVAINENHFLLSAERVAFWEEGQILLGSDLHWGREAFLQRQGFPVPEGVFDAEIEGLNRMIDRYRPKQFYLLGDLIHHPKGMHDGLKRKIRDWVSSHPNLEVTLIPGNHDRDLASWLPECGIALGPQEIVRSGMRFRHEPSDKKAESEAGPFTWYGHLHPALRISKLGNQKFPAFLIRSDRAFLPAFSRLAGGAEVKARNKDDRIYPVSEGMIFQWKGPSLS